MGRHRKAIAAGAGVALIALAEYAITTPDVARALESVVPAPWAQLVPVLFGGVATVAAVWRASNVVPSVDADTVDPPAPAGDSVPEPVAGPAALAASPPGALPPTRAAGADSVDPIADAAQQRAESIAAWQAQRHLEEPEARTALVQLLPVPAPDFR